MSKYLSIGRILNFHGVKGEVKVGYTKGKEDQLMSLEHIIIECKDKSKNIVLTPEKIRFHKQHAIIKFQELNSVEEVQAIKGCTLLADKAKIQEYLDKDEYLIDDLVGMKAYNTKEEYLGVVKYLMTQKGSEILSIECEKKKTHLVPFVKKLVPVVDLKKQMIVIEEIPGLINRVSE